MNRPLPMVTGAGEGNRTLVLSLGSFSSTIELHPLCPGREDALSPRRGLYIIPAGCDLQTYLATDHLMEVSTLSRWEISPLSPPLQRGIRFLHHPLPTTASDDLAIILVCQIGQTLHWAYRVPHK